MKKTTESLKCPETPQKPNGSTFGFKCCHHHVKKLIDKGLKVDQVNKYIDWRWCVKKIGKNNENIEKIRKNDNYSELGCNLKVKVIEERNKKIEKHINDNFTEDEIKTFTQLVNDNEVRRRSPRKKTAKQQADYNECMIMENDNELLENLEAWSNEENIHPDILHYAKGKYLKLFI